MTNRCKNCIYFIERLVDNKCSKHNFIFDFKDFDYKACKSFKKGTSENYEKYYLYLIKKQRREEKNKK